MANGQQFALQIGRFAKKAEGNLELMIRKVTLDLFARVVRRTPVDTGRARGNWQVGINSIPRGEFGAASEGRIAAKTTVAAGTADAIKAKLGDRVFIVNSVPYIFKLEKGSSKQAPAGMVTITLLEYQGIVQVNANEVRRGR